MDSSFGPRPTPIDDAIERAVRGGGVGLLAGLLAVGVGLLRAIPAFFTRNTPPPSGHDLGLVAVYVGAFTAAGALLGALWPLSRRKVGAFVLGYLGAGIVCPAIGYIAGIGEPHSSRTEYLFLTAIFTIVFGTVAGVQISKEAELRSRLARRDTRAL